MGEITRHTHTRARAASLFYCVEGKGNWHTAGSILKAQRGPREVPNTGILAEIEVGVPGAFHAKVVTFVPGRMFTTSKQCAGGGMILEPGQGSALEKTIQRM